MTCGERQRLFDQYYDLVSLYFSAAIRANEWDKIGEIMATGAAAEIARERLKMHEQEHGCGKPSPYGDDGRTLPSPALHPMRDGREPVRSSVTTKTPH